MRIAILSGALAIAGCATMTSAPTTGEQHQSTLPATGTEANGVKLLQGPFVLLQTNYLPAKGEGKALLWVSADANCPAVGPTLAFGTLTKYEAWYGNQAVGASEYLCASHSGNQTDGSLTWVTAK